MLKILVVLLMVIDSLWDHFLSTINLKYQKKETDNIPNNLPSALREKITKEDYIKALEYAKARDKFKFYATIYNLILVTLIVIFSLLNPLNVFTSEIIFGRVIFILILILILQLLGLPFKIYETFKLEAKFNFNKTTPKTFILDIFKGILVTIVILFPLLAILFFFFDKVGNLWWLYGFIIYTFFQLTMVIIYPLIIAPLFNKFTPLNNEELKAKIEDKAKSISFPIKGIFVMDGSRRSKHSNAYFTGLGKSKRVVLYDTLVEKLSKDEIVGVLAHEWGHFKLHHIKLHIVFSVIFSFIGFYILSILMSSKVFFEALGYDKPEIHIGLVLFSLILPAAGMFLSPLFNMFSRKLERDADKFAKKMCNGGEALIGALVKLNKDNLSVPLVHPFYSFINFGHPTLVERINALND